MVGLGFGRLLPMFKHGCTTSAADLQRKMQYFTVTWSKVILALTLVCSLRLSPVAAAECDVSGSVECGPRYSEGNCTFRKHCAQQLSLSVCVTPLRKRHLLIPACGLSLRLGNCTDLDNSVNVSFSACLVQRESSAASVRTYTKVSCKCPSGDITVRVELPNGQRATYRQLDTTPDPRLLNATRCDNRIDDTEPYSFCIEFADLTMVEDINATNLVSEVTVVGLALDSSKACIIIGFPGTCFT